MSTTPINLGIVGLSAQGSWASRAHIPYLAKSSHYKVVALQNSSLASAEAAKKKYDLPAAAPYGDIQSLCADPNVSMVIVSVKVPDHLGLTEAAILAKKDVFVEWPLGRSLAEAEHLTQLARKNNVRTLVGLQARHSPSVRKAKAMIDAGELGTILGTTMNAHGGILGMSITENYLYITPIENGANLITIPAGHAMDAMCWVLGEFTDLQATLANARPELPLVDAEGKEVRMVKKTSHDYMAVVGTLESGAVASVVYQGGVSRTGKNFYWEITGTKGSLVFEGPPGAMGHLQMFPPSLKFVSSEQGAELKTLDVADATEFSYNVGSAYDAFVGKGDGHVTTFEDAVVRHRMIEAIYKSDKEGTRETYKGTY